MKYGKINKAEFKITGYYPGEFIGVLKNAVNTN